MKIVIQCAGRKFDNAGRLTTPSGEKVLFVAHPERGNPNDNCCLPDGIRKGTSNTWRDYLKTYNEQGLNPNHLFNAGDLYKPPIYKALVEKFGVKNVFILSAGWGLIRSDYLIPYYNITFSNQGEPYSKRNPSDRFNDFNHLSFELIQPDETVCFFGGLSYLPLYCSLTRHITTRKVIYHSQATSYHLAGYECIHYGSYTNWHYTCAQDFINGKIPK